jgi:hypothetical protein
MRRKERDWTQTGLEPVPPWEPRDECPCGSGLLYARCCYLRFDRRAYKKPVALNLPPPVTNFSHKHCYMNLTHDCGRQISHEHFVSASVLSHLGGQNVRLGGMPWLAASETKDLPISAITAKILCKRHNEAFGPLDAMAGRFFGVIRSIHDNVWDKRTLSRRGEWYLFSGEELELWLLKTAAGLLHSGTVAKDKAPLIRKQVMNPICYNILREGGLEPPCGLYIEPIRLAEQTNQIQFQPASDTSSERMVGLRVSYLSFALTLLFDPHCTYGPDATGSKTYRPTYLVVRNAKRTHTIMLSWPLTIAPERGVVRISF